MSYKIQWCVNTVAFSGSQIFQHWTVNFVNLWTKNNLSTKTIENCALNWSDNSDNNHQTESRYNSMQTAAKSKLFQPALVTIADYALYVHTSQQSSKEQTSRALAVHGQLQWHAAQPLLWSPPTEFGIQEDPSRSSMHVVTHTCIVPHIHTSYEYKNQACIEDHAIECPQKKSPTETNKGVFYCKYFYCSCWCKL